MPSLSFICPQLKYVLTKKTKQQQKTRIRMYTWSMAHSCWITGISVSRSPNTPNPKLVKCESSDRPFSLFKLLPPGITVKIYNFETTCVWRIDLVLWNLTKVKLSPQLLCFSWDVAINRGGASRSPAWGWLVGTPAGSFVWVLKSQLRYGFCLTNSVCW